MDSSQDIYLVRQRLVSVERDVIVEFPVLVIAYAGTFRETAKWIPMAGVSWTTEDWEALTTCHAVTFEYDVIASK